MLILVSCIKTDGRKVQVREKTDKFNKKTIVKEAVGMAVSISPHTKQQLVTASAYEMVYDQLVYSKWSIDDNSMIKIVRMATINNSIDKTEENIPLTKKILLKKLILKYEIEEYNSLNKVYIQTTRKDKDIFNAFRLCLTDSVEEYIKRNDKIKSGVLLVDKIANYSYTNGLFSITIGVNFY